MRADQILDFIRIGLLNTLFFEDKDLIKNLSIFFGDGDIKQVNKETLNPDERFKITFHIVAKPFVVNQYDRTLIVEFKRNHGVSYNPFQIISIDE